VISRLRSTKQARPDKAGVTIAGEALGELVQSATSATAAAADHAQKIVQDTTATWAQAGAVAEDMVDTACRATRSVSRQIHAKPLAYCVASPASPTTFFA
jgi:hypothetical protein